MNTHQRLNQLESQLNPRQDIQEPLLVKFIGNDDPVELAGILYTYETDPATEYRLSTQQLADYEASERNKTTEVWLNSVPRPDKTVELDDVYKRKPSFRIDNSKTERSERVEL